MLLSILLYYQFSGGALLFVYGSYPLNLSRSNLFWQLLCCEDPIEPSEEDISNLIREGEERRTLLESDRP